MIIFISVLSIIAIYIIVALTNLKVCAICTAVSLTWLGVFIMYIFNMHNEIAWLGIMMGGSVIGLMYKVDEYMKKNNYKRIWLIRIFIVVFGFLFVYFLIEKSWQVFFWLIPLALISFTMAFLFLQKKSTTDDAELSVELQNKLDNCCD